STRATQTRCLSNALRTERSGSCLRIESGLHEDRQMVARTLRQRVHRVNTKPDRGGEIVVTSKHLVPRVRALVAEREVVTFARHVAVKPRLEHGIVEVPHHQRGQAGAELTELPESGADLM